LLVVTRLKLVSAFTTVTVAFATAAPVMSDTDPDIVALPICARTG